MEEGIVVRLQKNKGFGFIEREGAATDAYFRTRYVPGVEDGCRVQFEVEGPEDRPSAKRVKILQMPDGSPPGQPRGEPLNSQELTVNIEFGNTHLTVTGSGQSKKKALGIPVNVVTSRGNQLVPNIEVKLKPEDGDEMTALTLKDGKAPFRVKCEKDAESCVVIATVDGKSYRQVWLKEQPPKAPTAPTQPTPTASKPSEPTQPTEPPQVQRISIINGVYTYEITTVPKESVTINTNLLLRVKLEEEFLWSGLRPFTAGDDGRLRVQIRVEEDGARGTFAFRVKSFQSKPQFIAHHNRPQKEVKTHG